MGIRIIAAIILILNSGCIVLSKKINQQSDWNFESSVNSKKVDVIIEPYRKNLSGESFLSKDYPIDKVIGNSSKCFDIDTPSDRQKFRVNNSELGALMMACFLNKSLKENLREPWSLINGFKESKSDLIFYMKIRSVSPNELWRETWFYSSILTLGLIPTWQSTNIELQVSVYKNEQNRLSKIYSSEISYLMVGQTFLFFAMPFTPDPIQTIQDAVDYNLKKALIDLSQDGYL